MFEKIWAGLKDFREGFREEYNKKPIGAVYQRNDGTNYVVAHGNQYNYDLASNTWQNTQHPARFAQTEEQRRAETVAPQNLQAR